MSMLSAPLRRELAHALGLKALRSEMRRNFQTIMRELARLNSVTSARIDGAPAIGSTPEPRPSARDIRGLRERLGETRKEFAGRLGVSPGIVFLWESGKTQPRRAESLRRLREAMSAPQGGRAMVVRRVSAAKRTLSLSPRRKAALKLQGQYMGHMRQLKPRAKAKVKATKATKGYAAAIRLAKRLAA